MKDDLKRDGGSGLVFGAILPHGPDLIPANARDLAQMAQTRAAMEEAGRRFAAVKVDTLILLDPEIVHTLQGIALAERRSFFMGEPRLSISMSAHASGPAGSITERFACDVPLAQAIEKAGRESGFPAVPAAGADKDLALEGGAMVPLWFTVHPLPEPRPKIVVIAPGPTVPRERLLQFGELLAEVARNSGKRIALIASADQGHRHDRNHPRFGFSPSAARHDALYCEAVREHRPERLLEISDELVEAAFADSLWQTLILAGALRAVPMTMDFFSYALPTYYGMAVAVYEPARTRRWA